MPLSEGRNAGRQSVLILRHVRGFQVEVRRVHFCRTQSHTLRPPCGLASRTEAKGNSSFALVLSFYIHTDRQWDQNAFSYCESVTTTLRPSRVAPWSMDTAGIYGGTYGGGSGECMSPLPSISACRWWIDGAGVWPAGVSRSSGEED